MGAAPAQAAEVTDVLGNVLYVFLPAAAWASTYMDEDNQGRRQYYRALGSTVAFTLGANYLADEEGPDGQDYSFPSSHASVSFSAASFVQRRYGWTYAWPLYGAAAFVGWSRVEDDANEWRDVLVGAAIGLGFTYLFVEPRPDDDVRVSLQGGRGDYWVNVVVRW